MLRLTSNMTLLVFQEDVDADEGALAFPETFLNVRNGSLSQSYNDQVELPFSINRNAIQDLCKTVFSKLDQN